MSLLNQMLKLTLLFECQTKFFEGLYKKKTFNRPFIESTLAKKKHNFKRILILRVQSINSEVMNWLSQERHAREIEQWSKTCWRATKHKPLELSSNLIPFGKRSEIGAQLHIRWQRLYLWDAKEVAWLSNFLAIFKCNDEWSNRSNIL